MPKLKLLFDTSNGEASISPRATEDLAAIADYIRERNPLAALSVRTVILESLENQALFPHIGRPQLVEGVRKHVTREYPYLIYYTVDDAAQEIIILAVQHPVREREFSDA